MTNFICQCSSAFAIHSIVVGFIDDSPALADFPHEGVAYLHPVSHLIRRPHNQIHRDHTDRADNVPENQGGLPKRTSFERHHD